jgi:translation initiation factor IF-3
LALGRYKPSAKPNIPRFDRNSYIRAPKLLVVDANGDNLGVLDTPKALEIARAQELDLVLVNPQVDPPVARIIEWSKFKYEQSKKQKKNKKSSDLSEVQVKPFIDSGDLEHKLRKVRELLAKGNKVKFKIKYKRPADPTIMFKLMQSAQAKLEEFAKIESEIKREGRDLAIFLVSK